MWRYFLLALAIHTSLALPASAGIFFNRNKDKDKQAPAPRVPGLISTLKTDGNDGKRAAAAEELRQYDPKAYPEIVPALIEAAQRDAKPEVRSQAVQSLGKLKNVSPEAVATLQQVQSSDSSTRVRLHARAALMGQTSPKADSSVVTFPTNKEPPLADSEPAAPPAPPTARTVSQPMPRLAPAPVATPVVNPSPRSAPVRTMPIPSNVARPMPSSPSPLVPADPPILQSPPKTVGDGPMLNAPQ